MAISQIGSTVYSNLASGTGLSWVIPATAQEGDLLLVTLVAEQASAGRSFTFGQDNSGWTQLFASVFGGTLQFTAYWHRVQDNVNLGPGDTATCTTSASDEYSSALFCFRGAPSSGNPFSSVTADGTATAGDPASDAKSGFTTSDWVLFGACSAYGTTWTPPASWTEIGDTRVSTTASNVSQALCYRTGVTSAASATYNAATNDAMCQFTAILLAASAQTVTPDAIGAGSSTYAPTVSALYTVTPDAAASGETVYAPTVSQGGGGAHPIPVAGYSFDNQDGTDEIGDRDLNEFYVGFTTSSKHGAYAIQEHPEYLEVYAERLVGEGLEALPAPPVTLAAWVWPVEGGSLALRCEGITGSNINALIEEGEAAVSGDGLAVSAETPTNDAWNLLVVGRDDTDTLWISLNGETIVRAAGSGDSSAYGSYRITGSSGARADTFALWDETLTQADIDWLWNGGTGRTLAELATGGGGEPEAQEIAPAALASTAAVYAPTLTPGAVTVAPGAIASTATVLVPTVTRGAVTVVPGALGSGATLYAPTVTRGAVTVTPNTITGAAQVHAPSATPGAVTVAAGALGSVAVVHAPTVTTGVTVAPALVSGAAQVHAPTVTHGGVTITPGAITGAAVAYAVVVTVGAVTLAPGTVASAATVHAPALVLGAVTVVPNAIGGSAAVFAPSVAQSGVAQTVGADAIGGGTLIHAPTVQPGAVTVAVQSVGSATLLPMPTVTTAITSGAAAIGSGALLFAPHLLLLAVIAAERTRAVARESRAWRVDAEGRALVVDAEGRTWVVEAESRAFSVAAESRTISVEG